MDCIIYIDVFFLLNFWMNVLILFLIRKITKTYRTLRCIAAAAVNALAAAGLLLFFLKTEQPCVFLLFVPVIFLTNCLAFGAVSILWRLFLFVITGSLVAGVQFGLVSVFQISSQSLAIFLVSVAAVVSCTVLERQCRISFKEEHMKAKTVLEFGDRKVFATALMDTGNRLYDPFYHKPVILVEERMMKDVMEECRKIHPERMQYVPYHSVGKKNGMLEGIMFDYVSIQWQEKQMRFSKVIAVATREELYRGKEYQVIFHCGLLEEG